MADFEGNDLKDVENTRPLFDDYDELMAERKYLEARVDQRVTYMTLFVCGSLAFLSSATPKDPALFRILLICVGILLTLYALSVIRTQLIVFKILARLKAVHGETTYSYYSRRVMFGINAGWFSGILMPTISTIFYIVALFLVYMV